MYKVLITYLMPAHASQSGTGVGATHIIIFDTLEHLYERIERELYMFSILNLPEGEVHGFIIHPATEEDFYEKEIVWALGKEANDD